MSDPLGSLEDIEKSMPQMSADQELAMIKAPMYQSQKQTDLLTEATINQIYGKLIEKNAVIKALQSEIAVLKKRAKEFGYEVKPESN
jgi:hypothetical protein